MNISWMLFLEFAFAAIAPVKTSYNDFGTCVSAGESSQELCGATQRSRLATVVLVAATGAMTALKSFTAQCPTQGFDAFKAVKERAENLVLPNSEPLSAVMNAFEDVFNKLLECYNDGTPPTAVYEIGNKALEIKADRDGVVDAVFQIQDKRVRDELAKNPLKYAKSQVARLLEDLVASISSSIEQVRAGLRSNNRISCKPSFKIVEDNSFVQLKKDTPFQNISYATHKLQAFGRMVVSMKRDCEQKDPLKGIIATASQAVASMQPFLIGARQAIITDYWNPFKDPILTGFY